jgi:glycosyltransferase involved in cell wall biosynthesis
VRTLVSILIPAYNAERWIQETIQSALDQTWPHKEIIVVDDSSTDRTVRIAGQFESKIVKVVTQENSGASAARNRALSLAQGDYIQWLDADDLLAPDKIEQQLQRTGGDRTSKMLLSSAWATFYYRWKKAVFVPHALWQDLSPLEWLLTKFQLNVWQHPAAWLVSRRLTDLAGPWDERLSLDDDGEYYVRMVAASDQVAFVSEGRSFYRVGNTSSLSWSVSEKAADSLFLSTTLCIKHLLSLEDSSRTRSASKAFLHHRLVYFYPEYEEYVNKMNVLSRDLNGTALGAPEVSPRFFFLRRTLGWHAAKKVKDIVWKAEVLARKNWDKALHLD